VVLSWLQAVGVPVQVVVPVQVQSSCWLHVVASGMELHGSGVPAQ
jgi:hypothetical protein